MKINEANVEITRRDGKLVAIQVVMPRWDKIGNDETININLPLFNLKTFALNAEDDADTAINEVITAFCIMAEAHGNGIETELKSLGWQILSQTDEKCCMSYMVSDKYGVYDCIMQTGEQQFVSAVLENVN
jgi:hypothetical protein